jgi:hypothetical protein
VAASGAVLALGVRKKREAEMKTYWGIALLLVGCLMGESVQVRAQATASASLEGVTMDKTQAVLVGVDLTLKSKETGATRTSKSSGAGVYRFDLLPAGLYSLQAAIAGFATVTIDDIGLFIGHTTTINITLSPGALAQTITVTEEAPLVDQEKSSVGLLVTPSQIGNLPLNGRDFGNLAYLAPGAQPVGSYDPTKNRIAIFGINGSNGRNVNVTVNGIDNKDNTVGGPVMQLPLSAVKEFNISTQRFSAVNGRSEGAAVNVITKSGTNDFHGYAYFLDTQTALNANDFLSKQGSQPTPQFERQQFGGAIGGPIIHDRDFFFFALERQREHTSIPLTASAFTELTLVKSLGADPAQTIPTPYFDWRYNARVDHRFNSNHSAFFSYNSQTNRGLNDQSNNLNDVTAGNFTTNKLILANFTLNSVFGPKVVNAFTAGYQYWNNLIDTSKLSATTINFPGGIYFGTNSNVPQQSIQKKWQFRDDISINSGRHTFKTGVDFVQEPELGGFFEFTPVPTFNFLDLPSKILSDKATYPQGFSTPGAVIEMQLAVGDPHFFETPKMFGIYFQDDWKVRPGFTLNLGVRWDKDIGLYGSDVVAKSRTFQFLKAINSPYARSIPQDDSRGVSPRIGFAWDLHGNGKQVLRGGYGMYFGQTFENIPLFMIQQANATLFATVYDVNSAGPGDPKCIAPACTVPGTNILLKDWRFGVDPMPTTPPPPTNLAAGNTGRLMDPDYRNPYSQQWNIGYSFQIDNVSVLEVDYVHALAVHESRTININPTVNGVRILDAAFAAAGLPKLGPIDDEQSIGNSRYDGMNVSYKRRMSHHFTVNTTYVLSRAVGYQGSAGNFRNRPVNPFDPLRPLDHGPVPNDGRHRLVVSGIVELPWGFQVAPIMQLGSARPYTAIQGRDVYGFGARRGNAHAIVNTSDPTNFTANAGLSVSQLLACLASGSCIEVPFDSLRGQAFFNLDLRISNTIKLGEKPRLRLIWQMFDLTNRANFGNSFDGNVRNSKTFGTPNGYVTPSGAIVPKSFRAEWGAEFSF